MVEITPITPQKVPYKLKEELPEIPELNIEYSPIIVYPDPAWKDDYIIARKPEETEEKNQRNNHNTKNARRSSQTPGIFIIAI